MPRFEPSQFDFFGRNTRTLCEGVSLPVPEGDVMLYENFFPESQSQLFFSRLMNEISWQQDKINFYGTELDLPRLTAWHGDAGRIYKYSGIAMNSRPWTPALLAVEKAIRVPAGVEFNSVLLNQYRSGKDGVAWHSDDEPELGEAPVIGSVSFGGTRSFQLKHKTRSDLGRVDVSLANGSLLIMRGLTQQNWQHRIAKTKKPVAPRINLTFRVI